MSSTQVMLLPQQQQSKQRSPSPSRPAEHQQRARENLKAAPLLIPYGLRTDYGRPHEPEKQNYAHYASNTEPPSLSPLRRISSRLLGLQRRLFHSGHSMGLPAPVVSPGSSKEGSSLMSGGGEGSRSRWQESPMLWIALYFVANLTLTLYNKSVLMHFPFPYTLTGLHALCGSIGTFVVLRVRPTGRFMLPRIRSASTVPLLTSKERIVLVLFSFLYTVNIAVSNVSLRLVTVPFHQVVRASTPLFTILFSAVFLRTKTTRAKLLSLIPVMVGVGFATYGDYYFTRWGFFLTLLGTMLAALKTIFTHLLQSPAPTHVSLMLKPGPVAPEPFLPKLSLKPLHLLYLLSPLAFIQTSLLAHFTGELDRVRYHFFVVARETGMMSRVWLVLNGVLAFSLNIISFNANKRVGALGMSVAANVKQVLTILCAVTLFDLTITPMNGVGIVLTLVGGACYAAVEYEAKKKRLSAMRL